MGQKNKNQHYVPQFYLRGFVDSHDFLHVYDLGSKKNFKNKTRGVGAKSFFYDLNVNLLNRFLEDFFQQNDKQAIDFILNREHEEYYKGFIKTFDQVVEKIERKDKTETLSVIDFYDLVDFIIIMIYRNPKLDVAYNLVAKKIPDIANN